MRTAEAGPQKTPVRRERRLSWVWRARKSSLHDFRGKWQDTRRAFALSTPLEQTPKRASRGANNHVILSISSRTLVKTSGEFTV